MAAASKPVAASEKSGPMGRVTCCAVSTLVHSKPVPACSVVYQTRLSLSWRWGVSQTAHAGLPYKDGLSGLKVQLIYPYSGLNVELCGLKAHPGTTEEEGALHCIDNSCKGARRSRCHEADAQPRNAWTARRGSGRPGRDSLYISIYMYIYVYIYRL